MSIQILGSGQQLTETKIAEIEHRLGRTIPTVYRSFLFVHNGGYPEPCDFRIRDRNDSVEDISIEWFLGIEVDGPALEDYVGTYQGRLPETMFPIACDPGGDLICIGIGAENEGKIYFWDHEEEAEENNVPTYSNVYFIADSFDEFLNSLH